MPCLRAVKNNSPLLICERKMLGYQEKKKAEFEESCAVRTLWEANRDNRAIVW